MRAREKPSALVTAVMGDDLFAAQNALTEEAIQNINAPLRNGDTLLHRAVQYSSLAMVRLLLENSADPNAVNRDGQTPLHLQRTISVDMMQLLFQYSANVNLADINGDTPLHIAIRYNDINLVQTLLDAGADINCKNKAGFAPLASLHEMLGQQLIVKKFTDNEKKMALAIKKQKVVNEAIANLDDALRDLQEYATKLKETCPLKGDIAESYAKPLRELFQNFPRLTNIQDKSGMLRIMEATLKEALRHKEISKHCGWKRVIGNALIALTGVGLLFLAGKAIHSKCSTGKYTLFFNTATENKIEKVKGCVQTLNKLYVR